MLYEYALTSKYALLLLNNIIKVGINIDPWYFLLEKLVFYKFQIL